MKEQIFYDKCQLRHIKRAKNINPQYIVDYVNKTYKI